jgi:hypothetical protein
MSISSEVSRCIESMPDDAIIMADDFEHLGSKISTIYNTLSNLVRDGTLKRATKGAYVKCCRKGPSVDEIVNRKARRFERRVQSKAGPAENQLAAQYEYWTSGRTTSFRLLNDGKAYATVLLQERCRSTAERKRSRKNESSRSTSKASTTHNGTASGANKAKSHPSSIEPDRIGWWQLVWFLISEVVKPFENCLRMATKPLAYNRTPDCQQKLRLALEQQQFISGSTYNNNGKAKNPTWKNSRAVLCGLRAPPLAS